MLPDHRVKVECPVDLLLRHRGGTRQRSAHFSAGCRGRGAVGIVAATRVKSLGGLGYGRGSRSRMTVV